MPAPTQLSAYANHEFKIIPTPTQLSAYANHELKKQQERSIEAVHMHGLSETSRKQHSHRSRIEYIMNLFCSKTSEDSSTYAQHMHKTCAIAQVIFVRPFSCVFFFILVVQLVICIITFLVVFNIYIERILSEVYARHMRSATLTFKPFSQLVISFARFSALMLSSFIDVSLCSVDAAHIHRRGFDDQM